MKEEKQNEKNTKIGYGKLRAEDLINTKIEDGKGRKLRGWGCEGKNTAKMVTKRERYYRRRIMPIEKQVIL